MKRRIGLIAVAAAAFVLALVPASALARDRNHDHIPDKWEKAHHLSLKVNQARRDQDKDGLRNLKEFQLGTNPRSADTDHDGLDDGDEVQTGNDPTDADTNDDGIKDGHSDAGTIGHFDATTGMLTINLAGGGSVSGVVDSNTEIECESSSSTATAHESSDGSDDDNSGPGTTSSGDDNQGDDNQGDDNQGDDDQGEDQNEGTPCTTADLKDGTAVREAELKLIDGKATWEKVDIVK